MTELTVNVVMLHSCFMVIISGIYKIKNIMNMAS